MRLNEQPEAVTHLFSGIAGEGRYKWKESSSGRVYLLLKSVQIGGWADDQNGPHWFVYENKSTLALNPSYPRILEHFEFERVKDGERRHYWRVQGADGMWAFKRVVEEITGVRLTEA